MSAFLGPVHQWMYQKILFQEALSNKLLSLVEDTIQKNKLKEQIGEADKRSLEEIIDQNNIHGWLDCRVEKTEKDYADVVTAVLKQEGGLDNLSDAVGEAGRKQAISKGMRLSLVYQKINDVLLDGMPCAGGHSVISEENEELVFCYDMSLHTLCRQGDTGKNAFAVLRTTFLDGMLCSSEWKLELLGEDTYKIIRRKEDVCD